MLLLEPALFNDSSLAPPTDSLRYTCNISTNQIAALPILDTLTTTWERFLCNVEDSSVNWYYKKKKGNKQCVRIIVCKFIIITNDNLID